ncbi:hypothetical protein [Streptomyces sp. cmx-4-9]|uniref:hypothetical protein n=1 Tax=Streptomyces sp. cmx-4-9 TaxID=2790941 RepID=UPI00397F9EF9
MSTPIVLRPEDYGTISGRDSTTALQRTFAAADKLLARDAGGGVPVATCEIQLSGSYQVSDTIMPPASGRAQGLTIRGMGKRSSEIVMTGAAPLLVNADRWMGVRFYDCSFRSTNPAASFLYSTSTGGAQDWGFTNCEWRGTWRYGIGLDGPDKSNCNSEWFFNNCHVNGSYDVAWLWSGMTPSISQQDQFLNFSLRDCKVEYDSGDALRFDKGGSINVSGGSWIIKGRRADGKTSRFFHFPAGSHHDSVQSLLVEGVRFEPRDTANLVIESNWRGQVTFLNCMDDAWAYRPPSAADDYAPHRYTNPGGVRYQGCQLAGRHRYTQTTAPSRQSIVYDQSARTVASRRSKAAFYDLQGAYASSIRITHRDDRDGIT